MLVLFLIFIIIDFSSAGISLDQEATIMRDIKHSMRRIMKIFHHDMPICPDDLAISKYVVSKSIFNFFFFLPYS